MRIKENIDQKTVGDKVFYLDLMDSGRYMVSIGQMPVSNHPTLESAQEEFDAEIETAQKCQKFLEKNYEI